MTSYYLHQQIGTVYQVIDPDTFTSAAVAGQLAATDCGEGVPVRNADKVLFILSVGDVTATGSRLLGVAYSSTGSASDAGNSTDVWASSNAYFPTITSDCANEVFLLDLDLGTKGLTDAEGKLYIISTAVGTVADEFGVIGIPYKLKVLPSTNENTITYVA